MYHPVIYMITIDYIVHCLRNLRAVDPVHELTSPRLGNPRVVE